jgi:asparagine synthase (glutamine-hydrolysing)
VCGLLGGFWQSAPADAETRARRALARLAHRGPDDEGLTWHRGAGYEVLLGHRRLSIIDLSSDGHQPMETADGQLAMVFNGELYNYRELRDELRALGDEFRTATDSEVMLAAWRRWGVAALPRCIGMFALVVMDRATGSVTAVRDAFGIKPLYFGQDAAGGTVFGSELPAVLALRGGSARLDWHRAYGYLAHGQQDAAARSFVDGIRHVPPGHLLRVAPHQPVVLERWWAPNPTARFGGSVDEAGEEVRRLFLASVQLHMRSDVPVGAALSGGVDSSAIVCAMRHVAPDQRIPTFSFIADEAPMSEASWIALVAEYAGTDSHLIHVGPTDLARDLPVLVKAQGEPFGSTSIYAQFRVFQAARAAGVPVVLEGQGADELLAGYDGYAGQRMRSLLEQGDWRAMRTFAKAWRRQPGREGRSAWRALLGQMLPAAVHARAMAVGRRDRALPWLKHVVMAHAGVAVATPMLPRTASAYGRRVAEALAGSLEDQELPTLLRFGDRNAMHFSVENRVPFLTLPLADFLLGLPEEYLVGPDAVTKRVFRRAMRGIVPAAILDRKDKIGFATPMGAWAPAAVAQGTDALAAFATLPFVDGPVMQAAFRDIRDGTRAMHAPAWRAFNMALWMAAYDVQA